MAEFQALTIEQIKQIRDRGYTYFLLPNGITKKITIDDLYVDKKKADELLKKNRKNNT